MKRVLTAVILIPIVVIALFRAPLWLFALLVLGVALLAVQEYFDIAQATGFQPFRGLVYIFVSLSFVVVVGLAASPHHVFHIAGSPDKVAETLIVGCPLFLLLPPLYLLLAALQRDPLSSALADAAVSYLAMPYVAFTLVLLPLFRATWFGSLYLLFLMLLVWCGDIAAYYVGSALGKHKLAPRVSPGKTWEGAIASVAGAAIVGMLLFHFINPIADALRSARLLVPPADISSASFAEGQPLQVAPLWFVALFAMCVNVAAQLGDLVESALKRGGGVKDSGTLLPGHGGVLDRIDALLFALPVGLIFYVAGMNQYFSYPPYAP